MTKKKCKSKMRVVLPRSPSLRGRMTGKGKSRFLRFAAHDETVSSFGRNDDFCEFGGRKLQGKGKGKGESKSKSKSKSKAQKQSQKPKAKSEKRKAKSEKQIPCGDDNKKSNLNLNDNDR